MSRHVFKTEEPVNLIFSLSLPITYAYFDVGIGKVDFSLSVFAKFTGAVLVELFYGEVLLGTLGPMHGIGGITGTVTTVGTYEDNPGPYLTLKVKGVPFTGETFTDATFNLRADPATFLVPDSYASPIYFDMDGPTPRPWMTILTTPWFRGVSGDTTTEPDPPLDCANFATPAPIYGLPWEPFIGPGIPTGFPPDGGDHGGVTTTQIPSVITLPPVFPPNPTKLSTETVPPELPGPGDGSLPGLTFLIGDLNHVEDLVDIGAQSPSNSNIQADTNKGLNLQITETSSYVLSA
jgi:hypothetical protein